MAGSGAILTGSWGAARRALALTLAVFALLLQVNAPVQAAMMAPAGDDGPAICSVHQGEEKPTDKAPLHRQEACSVCSICALSGPAVVPDAAQPQVSAKVAAVAADILRQIAPRGPPARTPRARDPPLTA